MNAFSLKARLSHLEASSKPVYGPALRVIQHGELTAEQRSLIATATSEKRLVIIRHIVSPPASHGG
jgi:hypothetical protein